MRAGVKITVLSEVREASPNRDSWTKVSRRQGRESGRYRGQEHPGATKHVQRPGDNRSTGPEMAHGFEHGIRHTD